MDLYILKYNNYYNRIVKREVDLSSYLTKGTLIHTQYNVNYAPGDGVNIRQVLNNENYGDYAIYADGNTIVSRWFIIEANRNCKGQFGLTLRRDLVVDNFDTVLNADCFIEKAILPDNDPMIFNKENMTVNQIKNRTYTLADESSMGYIVGYTAKDPDNNKFYEESTIPQDEMSYYSTLANFKSDWGDTTTIIGDDFNADYLIYGKQVNTRLPAHINVLKGNYTEDRSSNDSTLTFNVLGDAKNNLAKRIQSNANNTTLSNALKTDYSAGVGDRTIKNIISLLNYDGKIVYDTGDKKYYKVSISITTGSTTEYAVPASGNMYNALKALTDQDQYVTGTPNDNSFRVVINGTNYTYNTTEVQVAGYKYKISTSHTKLNNSLYDMFVIPYSKYEVAGRVWIKGYSDRIWPSYDVAIRVANDLIRRFSGENGILKDIQMLPYCPMQGWIKQHTLGNKGIEIPSKTAVDWVTKTDASETPISCIIWCNTNEFEFTLPIPSLGIIDNVKLSNECDMIRLVAPNHQSMFEFSPARNNGIGESLTVKCAYKPFQPSVYIRPQFSGLYLGNGLFQGVNEARGLLFSGDFSMTQASNAWETYKRQNVNYLNIFDRQIQNMETTYEKQRTSSIVGGIASAIGSGVGIGSLIGGKGGLVGGIVSGAVSGAGLGVDIAMQDQLQNEALDYKRDMFNYQLGNIKAMPDTISKVDAFNPAFTTWPFIEYYTCTKEEKQAVANKIAYNSMSVGRIGKIKDFKDNKWSYGDIASKGYIKGSLIRVEIDEDTHYINELANEIYKGVYF